MKVTWLGQAGLLFETDRVKIMVDPYLSDSVRKVNPGNYRRVPVNEAIFEIEPDVMIFTHNHLDHYDPETVEKLIREDSRMTVLAPSSVWSSVRRMGGDSVNYVQFDRLTSWTEHGICFTAVRAVHSDVSAIGVILDDGEKKYYVTGDTLYNEAIFRDLPEEIYAVFLPVNGVGNNMNMADAARFARRIHARKVIPLHTGMFDQIDVEEFICENRVIPEIYRQISV